MINIVCVTGLVLLLFSSCKVIEKDVIGEYRLDRMPKTTLNIDSNHAFEFTKIYRNPYLHPFDHPDEYFFQTKGTWTLVDKDIISLTSQKDTLIYPLADVQSRTARNENLSHFTFYDTYGDTVRLLYTLLSDSVWVGRLHGTTPYFSMDLSERDTFEFHFYGYRPFRFVSGQKKNLDYTIILRTEFQPNLFVGTKFRIKRNRIIYLAPKTRIRFRKSAR